MFAEAWRLGRRCVLWLRVDLRGRRGTFSTSIKVCGSVAPGTPLRFVVAGVTLAAPLRGRCGTFNTSIDVCGSVVPGTPLRFAVAGVTLAAPLRGRCGTFKTSIDVCGSVAPGTPLGFVVAGVTLSASQGRFACQAWHFQYEHRCLRKRAPRFVLWWQA